MSDTNEIYRSQLLVFKNKDWIDLEGRFITFKNHNNNASWQSVLILRENYFVN